MDTFGANDANKTATKNLYWQWKLETGTTQDEIDSNDLLDSEWMGERITLGIEATGRQVTDNPATKYAVTFDLNGGTLANHGDSEQITKQVNYGEAYGNLPTPTKEGYRFVGWNGKNLLDYNKLSNVAISKDISVDTNGYISDSTPTTDNRAWRYSYSNWFFRLKPSNYIITFYFLQKAENESAMKNNGLSLFDSSSNKIFNTTSDYIDGLYNVTKFSKEFSILEITDLSLLVKAYDGVYRIQLEEGNTSTEWEPYYITSSTEVVQNQNHTLTAIWEPVSNP